ncbi:hypothetical protein N0V93_000610 [Gnomoniopsis smithogilvyi]|uniref:Cytochrome P450 n=1 Tax=Gnomoniopsis smithogilvyi TaxID=1191159 RepID=A0A9W8Z1Y1_9PEZI|nr:hypothetical protein N0V93_000610 [Gnomoniopsis smithogilvyi]
MSLSLASVALSSFTAVLAILIAKTVYRLFYHPLAQVPGPFLAKITSIWLVFHDRTLKRHILDLELHQRYGPIVRIAPNNVMLSSPAASKVIYSPKGDYGKSEFYKPLGPDRPTEDRMSLLTETDNARYRLIRRVTGPLLTTTAVKKHESLCDPVLLQYVENMTEKQGEAFDVLKWAHIVSIQLLQNVIMGDSDDIISSGDDEGDSELLQNVWLEHHWWGHCQPYYLFRRFLRLYLPKIGLKPPHEYSMDNLKCMKALAGRIKKRSMKGSNVPDPRIVSVGFYADVVSQQPLRPGFRESWAPLMANLALTAGIDSNATIISSVINLVARHPSVATKIQEELDTAAQQGLLSGPVPTYDECAALPYLQATMNETMRLHPSISIVLERLVPSGGVNFEGFHLPAGTKVGCNPRVVHRNEELFGPEASRFDPGRWLSGSEEKVREMEATSLKWGGGIRVCPGDKLSWVIMSKFLTIFFLKFSVHLLDMDELKALGVNDVDGEVSMGTTKWRGTYMRLQRR